MSKFEPVLPEGYSARPMRVEDAQSIVEMLNLESLHFIGERRYFVDDYAYGLQKPGFDIATQSRIVHAADGTVSGIAEVFNSAPFVRPFVWARTHMDHSGRGIGTWLTAWAEATARTMMERAPADAQVTCGASIFEANVVAARFLRERGYAHVRNFHIMRIEQTQAPAPVTLPDGMTLHTMIPDVDDRRLYAAFDEAFQDHWGHVSNAGEEDFQRWQHFWRNYPHFDPSLLFIARDGDEIAGFSLCSLPVPGEIQLGWVNQLGVRRPWRGRGLAKALLLHSFGEFFKRGLPVVGLGVDASSLTGATRLYESAGMRVHHTTAAWEKELRPGTTYATLALDE